MNKFKYYFFFCVVVVMISLLPFGTAFADLNMTFEDGIGSWERTSGSGTMTTEYIDSTPCLTVDSPSESTVYKMTLPEKIAASGTYVLSYDIIIPKINTGSGKQTFVIEGHSTNGLNSFYGLMIDNGVVCYNHGKTETGLSSATKNGETDTELTLRDNTWHNLKTIYNRDDGEFTYFVDNIPVLDSKGNILKVKPYPSVKDYEIDSLVIRARNDSDDKKIYVKNISLCELDSDITQGAMYNSFAGGVGGFELRGGTAATDTLYIETVDAEHGKSMRLSTSNASAYHDLTLTDKIIADNDIYELGYEIYFKPYTAADKQVVSVVGLGADNVNTFYGLRLENGADGVSVLYYNGEGQYDTSTGYTRDGNKLLISHNTWHKIKTVWDRASSMFTYYIDSVPVYTAKGDIARPHVRSSEINKTVSKISIISRNTKDIPAYIDNLYLTRTENSHIPQGIIIYNAAFVDDNGNALNPDNMASVTDFSVKFDYDAAENFTPIIAFYDGDTLKDVAQYSVDVSKDGYTTGKVLQATNIYGAPNVKFFVWDGFKNLVPYKVYTKAQNKKITQKLNVTTVSNEYFTMWGDSLTIVSKTDGKSVVLKAPVISPTIKEDGTAKGPETRYYINFTVNDKSYHNRKDGIVYELVVKYFDEGYGVFTLEYDTIYESLVEAEYVELGNTNTWKTHTFVLKNPCFTGEGVDFRLCTWGEKMRYSNYDVPFGRVTLRSRGTRDQFAIKSVGDNVGNIYYTGDTATFTTTISNRDFYEYSNTFGEYNATVKYTLLDVNKEFVKDLGENTVTISPISTNSESTISFNMDKYGLYFLKTEVINDEFELLGENITELSYVHSDKKTVNYDYGTSIQTGLYPISSDDPKTTTNGSHNLAKYAGIGMLRYVRSMSDAMKITYGSSGSNLSQGTYDADWGKYDSLMKSNGYILLNNLLSANMRYSNEVDSKGRKFTVPHGKTGLDYFAQYCTFFAKEYKDKYPDEIRYYEIWNEFDSPPGSKYNYNGDDWDYYGDILVAAADAIYDADPEAVIVALSSRFVNSHKRAIERVEDLIDEGIAKHELKDYFTNVSIHPYYRNDNPMNLEVHSESCTETATNLFEHMEILRKIYAENDKPLYPKLWISEIAWSPGYINFDRKQAKAITEKQQGSYLVQTYVMTRKNTDKYLPYLFSRNVNVRVDNDDNMGIIKNKDPNLEDVPYAATSAYLATANLNMLMTGAEYVSDFFFNDAHSSTAYRFTKADGKDLAILWSIYEEGEDVSINLGAESVTMYDEYGNTTTLTSEDGIYNLNLTQSTVYLEGEFTAFAKE